MMTIKRQCESRFAAASSIRTSRILFGSRSKYPINDCMFVRSSRAFGSEAVFGVEARKASNSTTSLE